MSLCDRCRHALIYERATGAKVYRCSAGDSERVVPGDIVHCSEFSHRTMTPLWELREIAWRIERGTNGQITGFRKPKDPEHGGR